MSFKFGSIFLVMIFVTTFFTSFVEAGGDEKETKIVHVGSNELHIPSHLIMSDNAGLVDAIGEYFGMSRKPVAYLEIQFSGDELLRLLDGLDATVKEESFLLLGMQSTTAEAEIIQRNSQASSWIAEIWGDQSLIVTKVDRQQLFEVRLSAESIGWSLFTVDPRRNKFTPDNDTNVYVGSCTRKSDSGICTGAFIVNGLQVRFAFPSYLSPFSLDIRNVLKREISSWEVKSPS